MAAIQMPPQATILRQRVRNLAASFRGILHYYCRSTSVCNSSRRLNQPGSCCTAFCRRQSSQRVDVRQCDAVPPAERAAEGGEGDKSPSASEDSYFGNSGSDRWVPPPAAHADTESMTTLEPKHGCRRKHRLLGQGLKQTCRFGLFLAHLPSCYFHCSEDSALSREEAMAPDSPKVFKIDVVIYLTNI